MDEGLDIGYPTEPSTRDTPPENSSHVFAPEPSTELRRLQKRNEGARMHVRRKIGVEIHSTRDSEVIRDEIRMERTAMQVALGELRGELRRDARALAVTFALTGLLRVLAAVGRARRAR